MQNTWVYQKVEYRTTGGIFGLNLMEPDEEQLKEALGQIVQAANEGGWTITALTHLPHERIAGMAYGVTLVATLSKP